MPVMIHGKEYKTVSERTNEFHAKYIENIGVDTTIIQLDESIAVVKAVVTKPDGRTFSGHAFELSSTSGVNETSHLENAETSAVGRALAFAGFAGVEIASANEVEQAMAQRENNKAPAPTKSKAPDSPIANDNKDRVGMVNKYAKKCANCEAWVEAGEGWVEKTEEGKWVTRCTEDGICANKEAVGQDGLPF